MRIAHLMAGSAGGGAELFFERLAMSMHHGGDTVLPVIRRDQARAARLRAAGLDPVLLPFGGRLDLRTSGAARRTLARFAPDVAVAWMNRAARFAPTGDWVLAGRLGGYYDLDYYARCTDLIGNTPDLVAWMARQGWPAGRCHYLPNFSPDFGGAAPSRAGLPEGVPVVLAMGRLHRNKGFDVLIRAMALLPGVTLLIAGAGSERAALEALARGEAVADRVRFLGWRDDQAALLAGADLLAVPSRHEPLGNVVIEGFSARRPVVAAATVGPAALIRDGETGLLVPPEDARRLAEAIASLIEDPGRAARLAATARAEYETRYAEAPVLASWREGLGRMLNRFREDKV